MIYIYDILLNFCDCDMIYDFYEWSSDDNVENIKRIKLIHVENKLYDRLLSYNVEVDNDFLIKVFKTCEVYDNKKVVTIDYCCLFSDGNRVLAIEFDKKGNSIYKSKLLIEDEDEIAILANNLELSNIKFKIRNKVLKNRFVTRSEILIKKVLIKEIESSYRNKKYDKLRYLYQEYFEESIDDYKQMKDRLIFSIDEHIDDKHRKIYNLLKLTMKSNKYKNV